jgi:hypothetical protein
MKSRVKRTLLVAALGFVNAALGVGIYCRSADNAAFAQTAAMQHTMDVQAISGRFGTGASAPATLYLFDSISGDLVALRPAVGGASASVMGRANVYRVLDKIR